MSYTELSPSQVKEAIARYQCDASQVAAPPAASPHDDLRTSPPFLGTSSYASSPECPPIDPCIPIPEEDEEDETCSEQTANEPLTPTETQHSLHFHESHDGLTHHARTHVPTPDHAETPLAMSKAPLIISTPASPPPPSRKNSSPSDSSAAPTSNASTPGGTTPLSRPPSSRENIRRGLSQIFRRSNSSSQTAAPLDTLNSFRFAQAAGHDVAPARPRRMSAHLSSSNVTTRSNSPPSPGSPSDTSALSHQASLEPHPDQFLTMGKKGRSSTGLGIRSKFITFAQGPKKVVKIENPRGRATSVEDFTSIARHPSPDAKPELRRNPWALAPDEGTGLKARRLSLNLPDDFTVDVIELGKEFADQSKIVGRRGKMLGKGATSTVKLMVRKGTSELYAVKEFRGKQSSESAAEYENKVKSEYCIAKSLHHPSIVETVRLCTQHGRWNHVMEFCGEGDLFSFVKHGFLKSPERKTDRLCLFKQLVLGVQYLHSHGIAHRDIKLENLLITADSKLKITDFGVSEVFSGIHPGLRAAGGQCGKDMCEVRLCSPGICGSLPYIAPEVISKKGDYDPRPLDVWSSAVVMLHLIFGGALWQQAVESPADPQYVNLVRGWRKWEAAHSTDETMGDDGTYPFFQPFDLAIDSPVLRRILMGMLHPDAARRWSIDQVANHRWLKTVECCQMDTYDDPARVFDVSKSGASRVLSKNKVVKHNHLIPPSHKGHGLVRLPGSTDMD